MNVYLGLRGTKPPISFGVSLSPAILAAMKATKDELSLLCPEGLVRRSGVGRLNPPHQGEIGIFLTTTSEATKNILISYLVTQNLIRPSEQKTNPPLYLYKGEWVDFQVDPK
ncbi:MAG: hypothetical protein K2X66_04165 [Cyanobacteria bacterium]|nr:hypothetical protein [Cyanobacteriota bacterium]